MEHLYFIHKYGGYGLFIANKYGVNMEYPPIQEWIQGPVKLVIGDD
jgi:hypothetical protein